MDMELEGRVWCGVVRRGRAGLGSASQVPPLLPSPCVSQTRRPGSGPRAGAHAEDGQVVEAAKLMVTAEMGTKVPFRRLEVPRTECGLAAPMSGVVSPRGVWVSRSGGGLDPGSFARAGRARGSRQIWVRWVVWWIVCARARKNR